VPHPSPGEIAAPIAIVGPTASGKTALAIGVALALGAEIISMDSRQLYRGMDIGTAKATSEERAAVPHHGLDLVAPDERFSAGRFARFARKTMDGIHARRARTVLVGGTGFFLRALTHPTFAEPELDPARRAELGAYLERFPTETLLGWLRALDPVSAERLASWGGRQRILRALEMPLLTGKPLSWWHVYAGPQIEPLRPLVFVLDLPRELLDERIARRVREMADAGLVDEVAGLMAKGYDEQSPGMNAVGYREMIPHLRGETGLDAALEEIRRNTRAYSRRQRTWFRGQLPVGAVWLDGTLPREELVRIVVDAVRVGTNQNRRS
jgi:tRNA dimethylallyltransferase